MYTSSIASSLKIEGELSILSVLVVLETDLVFWHLITFGDVYSLFFMKYISKDKKLLVQVEHCA